MIPSLIFTFSVCGLAQFALAYCRSLLLAYGKVDVSEHTRQLTGPIGGIFKPREFDRLMALTRMQEDPGDDATEIRAVTLYYGLLRLGRFLASPLDRNVSNWFNRELSLCDHFAAGTLDRRLAVAAQ